MKFSLVSQTSGPMCTTPEVWWQRNRLGKRFALGSFGMLWASCDWAPTDTGHYASLCINGGEPSTQAGWQGLHKGEITQHNSVPVRYLTYLRDSRRPLSPPRLWPPSLIPVPEVFFSTCWLHNLVWYQALPSSFLIYNNRFTSEKNKWSWKNQSYSGVKSHIKYTPGE